MVAETSEFRGYAILRLKRSEDDNYPFSLGVGKCKLILQHLDDIRAFVEENDFKEDKVKMPEEIKL